MGNVPRGVYQEQLVGTAYEIMAEPSLALFRFHTVTDLRQCRITERRGRALPLSLSNISHQSYSDWEGGDGCSNQVS